MPGIRCHDITRLRFGDNTTGVCGLGPRGGEGDKGDARNATWHGTRTLTRVVAVDGGCHGLTAVRGRCLPFFAVDRSSRLVPSSNPTILLYDYILPVLWSVKGQESTE